MEHQPCVVWYLDIESESSKERPTLTLVMEIWDFWWVSSVQGEKQCGLANCDGCENLIQTSSDCNAGISFTLWLVFADDVAVVRCAWRSGGWDYDGKARCRGTVFCSEAFDACHPAWRLGRSTGCDKCSQRVPVTLQWSGFRLAVVFYSVSDLAKIPARFVLAELLPGPDINPRFFGRVQHTAEPHFCELRTLAPNKYLSWDCITIWYIPQRCSIACSFTSYSPLCDPINIRWVAVKWLRTLGVFCSDAMDIDWIASG